jgi:PAS domain S-box-containing protein
MSLSNDADSHRDSAAPGELKNDERERRYRAIFENPFDVIAVLEAVRGPEGTILDWRYRDANVNCLRWLGRTGEQLLGKTVGEVLPARAADLIPLYTRVLNQSRPQQYEERSGDTDLLISLFPIGSDAIVTSGVDISARIRVEAEVRRLLEVNRAEREWLSAVLDSMTEEVYFADAHERYTYANPAALREFGHDTVEGVDIEKIVSQLEVLRPDGTPRPLSEAPPVRALAGETVRDDEQIVRIPRTGELRHRQVSSAPVRDSGGKIIGSVSVVRDVTDTRLREKESREAERRRKKLITTLAHELRNPLAPLRTGIELLRKVREQPQLLETVPPMMERQIRQLVALIDRLLDVFQDTPPS